MLPHELTNHVFLQHMMASLDALAHDAKQRSFFHQVESSRQFRRVVPIVTETNWLASMIFGIGLMSFHFQTARIMQPESNNPDPFKALLVLRYSAPLAKAIGPWFMNSMLPSMIRRNNEASLPLDERDDMAILNLHTLLDGDILSLSTNAHAVCEHAIHALYQWLFVTSGRPRTWRDFIEWPAAISDEFLVLAQQQKHPAAVIILIHWCAVMSNAPKTWFMGGWAVAAALQAMSWLDESWRQSPGMVWARENLDQTYKSVYNATSYSFSSDIPHPTEQIDHPSRFALELFAQKFQAARLFGSRTPSLIRRQSLQKAYEWLDKLEVGLRIRRKRILGHMYKEAGSRSKEWMNKNPAAGQKIKAQCR
ncbi:unnamed protein product [Clonostachys rhizophaga]|uniref:Uncharacterized protein n=1 Tax=Clonostachys rhizophaga TaxID=160324 RepID=A0A9N9VP41_9HYPO|nr:unnamed protein product [Clonostachys rhizophaga]